MSPKICVLGAGGMIGRYLVKIFDAKSSAPSRDELDLHDFSDVIAYLKNNDVDIVVNAVGTSISPWRALYDVNSFMARNVAEACAFTGKGLVYLSSARVFSASAPEAPSEEALPTPNDDYGLSKFLGERFSQMCGGPNVWVLRMPMVLGFRPDKPERQIVTRLLQRALQGQATAVATDVFTQVVHVSDVAAALTAIWRKGAPAGIYHLVSRDSASLYEIVSLLFDRLGLERPRPGKAIDFNPADLGPIHLVLGAGSLSKLLPCRSWVDAVVEYSEQCL